MKAIIPVAGKGTRLKPHTHTTPKPLLEIAGKPILSYILDEILFIPEVDEIVLIVGYFGKEIENYVSGYVKNKQLSFVYQEILNGDGGAIKLAIEDIYKRNSQDDEVLVLFGDTLIDVDLRAELALRKNYDGIIFSKDVKEPWLYGIIETDKKEIITSIVEKPLNSKSNLAVIGAYWFKSMDLLYRKINFLFENNITTKGEFKLADAIALMIKDNLVLRSKKVNEWFDCGRVDVLLDANKYVLKKLCEGRMVVRGNSLIIGPSYVSRSAKVENSVIGPFASIGEGAVIRNSIIRNSIVGKNTEINNLVIENSVIGKEVVIDAETKKLNVGDNSFIVLQ
ncbi:MAG: sugar phosphate nucleotidyltransferase [Candidatus Woesearchaeota archaeon]